MIAQEIQEILVVEDNLDVAKLVKYNLGKAGFDCFLAKSSPTALDILNNNCISLIILDRTISKAADFEIIKHIKQNERLWPIPIIMLTDREEKIDKINDTDIVADDYIVRPFSMRELVLRTKVILNRISSNNEPKANILKAGKIIVDMSRYQVLVNNKEIFFTQMEFELLCNLIERRGRVQSRERLLQDVWHLDSNVDRRTVDVHIVRLRRKLGKSGKMIETVRGRGYRFSEKD